MPCVPVSPLLGVPNCVNLRKRITVPLGRGKWVVHGRLARQRPTSGGHVREPDVARPAVHRP